MYYQAKSGLPLDTIIIKLFYQAKDCFFIFTGNLRPSNMMMRCTDTCPTPCSLV